jgi:hypothetical protein
MWAGGVIVSGIFGLIGWFINMIFKRIDEQDAHLDTMESRLDAHRLYAAETFTTKRDVEKLTDKVIRQLERIEDKIDRRKSKANLDDDEN